MRFLDRAWYFLGEHPLTLLGVVVGLGFALTLWTRTSAIERRVERVERSVVVIQRDAGKKGTVSECRVDAPRSRACVELRRTLLTLSPAERARVLHQLRGDRSATPRRAPARP